MGMRQLRLKEARTAIDRGCGKRRARLLRTLETPNSLCAQLVSRGHLRSVQTLHNKRGLRLQACGRSFRNQHTSRMARDTRSPTRDRRNLPEHRHGTHRHAPDRRDECGAAKRSEAHGTGPYTPLKNTSSNTPNNPLIRQLQRNNHRSTSPHAASRAGYEREAIASRGAQDGRSSAAQPGRSPSPSEARRGRYRPLQRRSSPRGQPAPNRGAGSRSRT